MSVRFFSAYFISINFVQLIFIYILLYCAAHTDFPLSLTKDTTCGKLKNVKLGHDCILIDLIKCVHLVQVLL